MRRVVVVYHSSGDFDLYSNARTVFDLYRDRITYNSYKTFMRALNRDGSLLFQFADFYKIERKPVL